MKDKNERATLIAALGMEPERPGEDRYAATTGELWKWVQEQRASECGHRPCGACGAVGYEVSPGRWTTGCCCEA